ncbi:MAG: LysR family transcriptional regulator [Candidatus Nitronauta litoralis]|uniref:LysR family transcriptional regulator n=1 Tax=Candidatus Nitronauta litoralis TaxID=2705533 RepID=A0A7T0G210_9BACT|nr:MAG: LysR family transcriptional regulator [Candidatus Nitronauta litoralis]
MKGAAKKLGIGQTAIRSKIKTLEEILEQNLFEKKIEPSPSQSKRVTH